MGGLYSLGALIFPHLSGQRLYFFLYRNSLLTLQDWISCWWGNLGHEGQMLSWYVRPQPCQPCLPFFPHHHGGAQSTGAELKNTPPFFERFNWSLAAHHSWKHPSNLSHAACPRSEQPALVNDLGNVGLPRSRKSVAGEGAVTAIWLFSCFTATNFLPPLTITYVGFLNSFFLHSCLNSMGKRKRRLDVEN